MKAQEVLEDAVGRRVSCDGERGTVRYVGPVPPTAGLWLGVEWDDPERGKHDGSHEGVRYFTCRLEKLTEIGLRRCEVSGPGPENEIRNTTPLAQSLDLSGNLLSSWEVLAAVTEQLEALRELQLSHNRLSISSEPSRLSPAFSCLRVLSLNSCALTWTQVLHCAPMWQHLEELYLADNDITELLRPQRVLQTLKVLDLSNNHIVQETVLEISHLPCLEKLNLSSSGLSVIQFSDASAGNKTALFPALKTLLLDDNNISERQKTWSFIRCCCQVLSDERRGAELDYCKKFGLDWLKAGGHSDPEKNHPNTEFMSEHPRFLALLQKYGAPDEGELKEQKPFALKNQLLTLTFVCPEDSERKPIEKKLPGSMIVQKVKGLLHRLLKLPGMELKLSYTCSKMAGREIEIDNDLKPLEFYSVEDGDRILVRWS
ncbi:hypothetical protein cypCar_00034504 [Cyprinus carpio]|nr:hypothetical protein cypCar_00034504 [Cyprinus carpio]